MEIINRGHFITIFLQHENICKMVRKVINNLMFRQGSQNVSGVQIHVCHKKHYPCIKENLNMQLKAVLALGLMGFPKLMTNDLMDLQLVVCQLSGPLYDNSYFGKACPFSFVNEYQYKSIGTSHLFHHNYSAFGNIRTTLFLE